MFRDVLFPSPCEPTEATALAKEQIPDGVLSVVLCAASLETC